MGYAAIRALFMIGAIAGTSAQYFGKDLGRLSSLHHGVKGNVFAVDSRTLYLKDFQYDGEGPAAYFYVGSSKSPNSLGAVRLRDERGGTGPLRRYRGEGIALSLPDGKTLKDFKWFSVWCDEFSVNFGDVSIPRDTQFPRPSRLTGLRGAHNVHSDPIVVVDAQTLLIPNFSYDGEAPDAKFWVGRGDKPSPQGIRIPDENGKEAPLRRYDKKTIVLTLPGELTVFDIGYFSVWCEAFTVDFGHVLLPTSQLQNVPPSLKMLGVSPQSKLNCEVLYDELAFEVRWAVAGDSIVLQLVGKLEDNDYMAFGISGDSVHSQMVGGDVAVAWVNKETLKGYVFDYFLDSKSQCAGVRGSCPDEALGAKTNSVRLLNAALVNGYSIVTYQRSLKAADGLDQNIYTNMSQPIIWALGPLNSKNEVSYHHHFNKGDRLIDFGRAPVWNCPMPEGEDGSVDQYHGQKQQQQQVQKNPDPKPVEHYQTHEIKPNPVPAPKPVPKVVPWEIPPIQCYEPADGVLYAQMGPTGGKQGYSAITGHVGWGISWYINGLLIPEINVVRGKKYTFVVEGGTDPEVPAKYHPFYITDDPVGGYFHKTPAEKQKVNIYAGVRRTRTGELIPTGVGRLCNWTPDTQGPEADEFPSFGAYQRSLTLVCDPGNPGVVHWIPDRNTPDTVYYQCFTHRHLGWKINVVDSCEVQDPEESRVVDVFEQPDQRQEESLQVESRINSNSNFLDQHKKVEKIINTNKSNYDNFSSNKAGNYGGQESIQPFSNAQKYELPVSKGQIKHVIEAVESIESQMQNEARKNLTNLAHNQYLVHENNNEQSLFEQPIVDNEEYIIEHPKAPGSHFLPANYKPHTLQSVLRANGQRPVGPIRPPNRRPTPPEIKLRRPNPPPSFHEGYNNRNNFFTPHNQNHNYVYPQKKTHPQKYPSRVQPPNYHSMHSKPNPQNKNNMSPYNQPPGHFPYKAPHKPINPPLKMMGMPPYKLNPGPVNQNQNVNKGDPEIIANQVVKSQILLPGANDAEVQQSVQSQSYINRPDQIILGKPIENPTPLDQHMVPNKQYNIQSAPITPPPRPRYQTTTPKIENIENIPIPNSNSDQPEIQSSDFLGHQVETSSFSPAVNTGFKPDTVVIESGFKPIIREPLMDRTDGYAVEDERHGDEKQNGESFSNNLKNPQRRVDADIEDYVEAAPQHLTNTNFNSNNKVTETFEPMFMPSPEDHSLNTELNTEKTKEVFPLNHAKEDRPHPVYTPTKKPEGINLFSEKKNENEMPSDMLMDSDKISPQYLPPEVPKDHTPHNSKAEETYTTYDGKTVSAATLTSVPEVNNYDDEFFSWKLPANSEKLLKSPQLGPFRGEIPPSSDMFLEDEAMSGQNDRFKLEASSDVKTSKNDKEQHKLMKRDEDILAELRKLVESDDNEEISDSDYEEEEGKRRKREVQTTQYEKNYESTTSTTQQSFTNGHMHHTEYESTNRSTIRTSQLYLVLLVLGMRYI